jgi:hypothetical protein
LFHDSDPLANRHRGRDTRHRSGGLGIPWRNTVDGNDTLWAFIFGDEHWSWPDTAAPLLQPALARQTARHYG